MNKVIVILEFPKTTKEQYDLILDEMVEKDILADKARFHHVAGTDKGGMVIIDIWDSEETFCRFSKIFAPVATKYGVTIPEPKIIPVYNILIG
jgi:hypothetical protein